MSQHITQSVYFLNKTQFLWAPLARLLHFAICFLEPTGMNVLESERLYTRLTSLSMSKTLIIACACQFQPNSNRSRT